MLRRWLLLGSGGGVVLAVACVGWWQGRSTAAELAALKAQVGSLSKEEPANDGQVAAALLHLANGQRAPGQAAPVAAVEPAKAEILGIEAPSAPSTEELQQQIQAESERLAQGLDSRLETEPADYAWSRAQQAVMRDLIQARAPGAAVVDSKCGATLCRVTVAHESAATQKELPNAISWDEPFVRGTFYRYEARNGVEHTMLYVAREGRDLKTLAEP